MANETEVSKQIREAVKKNFPQIRFKRNHCGKIKSGRYWVDLGEAGWPDYIGYLPDGRFFGLEIKDPKGRTKKDRQELQDTRLADIGKCGGVGIKASSVDEALTKIREFIGGTTNGK